MWIFGIVFPYLLLIFPLPSKSKVTTWNSDSATGNWSSDANWNNGTPQPGDTAIILNYNTSIIATVFEYFNAANQYVCNFTFLFAGDYCFRYIRSHPKSFFLLSIVLSNHRLVLHGPGSIVFHADTNISSYYFFDGSLITISPGSTLWISSLFSWTGYQNTITGNTTTSGVK